LKVGDRVVCLDSRYIFKVIEHKDNVYLECENAKNETQFIHYLLNVDFEILPQPKRVGDLKCKIECENCPLRALDGCSLYGCIMFGQLTLYEILEKVHNDWLNKDQEIYDLLKARLDKEVEEE